MTSSEPVSPRRLRPGRRTAFAAALAGLILIATFVGGALTGAAIRGEKTRTVAITDSETIFETVTTEAPPDASEDAPNASDDLSEDGEETAPGRTEKKIGSVGYDDGLAFRVDRLEVVSSVPQDEFSDGPVTPVRGAKLVTATVTFTNNTSQSVDPFCGGRSAILLDERDRNFEPLSDKMISIPGNEVCGEAVQPGFRDEVTLLFQIPRTAKVGGLALWNGESDDDPDGDSYLVFTP